VNLPDVADDRAVRDFIQAVPSREFTSAWLIRLQNIDETPDLYSIVQQYREYFRDMKAMNEKRDSRIAYTTFQEVPIEETTSQNPRTSTSGIKADQTTRINKPCLCGRNHAWRNCYYLNELIRPSYWVPNPAIKSEINEKIKNLLKIRQTLEQIKSDFKLKAKLNPNSTRNSIQNQNNLKSTNPPNKATFMASRHGFSTEVKPSLLPLLSLSPLPLPSLSPSLSPSILFNKASFMDSNHGYSTSMNIYPLKKSFILDSGATIHVCNDKDRFIKWWPANGDTLKTGDSEVIIEAYGIVIAYAKSVSPEEGFCILTLEDVAYVPTFHTNLVSFDKAIEKGIHWDTKKGILLKNDQPLCQVNRKFNQWVIEYNPIHSEEAYSTKKSNSTKTSYSTKTSKATPEIWHRRMGHLNYEAVFHLPEATKGVIIDHSINPTQTPKELSKQKCEICNISKASKKISRIPSERATEAFERIHFDLIPFNEAFNNHKWAIHFLCDASRMHFLYTMINKGDLFEKIRDFYSFIKTQWNCQIKIIYLDREPALGNQYFN